MGDLQMLLGSVGAGGNSVLARFSVGCPTFFAALLVEIGCWCRWARVAVFRDFTQA